MTTHKLAKWLLEQSDMACAIAWDSGVRETMDDVRIIDCEITAGGLVVGGAKCMLFGDFRGVGGKTAFDMTVEETV